MVGALYMRFHTLRPLDGAAGLLRQQANVWTLRGLFALEAGQVQAAGEHCRAALAIWGSDSQAASGAGLDFPSRPVAQQVLRLLARKDEG
jgi:hypothetical protein